MTSAAPPPEYVTVAQAARLLNVSRGWVYLHADDLPVVRLGEGPKAMLRIDVNQLRHQLSERAAR